MVLNAINVTYVRNVLSVFRPKWPEKTLHTAQT
jgi:hypothetical protein